MIDVHKVLIGLGFIWAAVFQLNVEGSFRIYSSAATSLANFTNSPCLLQLAPWYDWAIPYLLLVFSGLAVLLIFKYGMVKDYENKWNKRIWATNPNLLEKLEHKFNRMVN